MWALALNINLCVVYHTPAGVVKLRLPLIRKRKRRQSASSGQIERRFFLLL